jgi:hypothetical protein
MPFPNPDKTPPVTITYFIASREKENGHNRFKDYVCRTNGITYMTGEGRCYGKYYHISEERFVAESMAKEKDERREKLLKMADKIIQDMEDHQVFGFILANTGKKGVPEIIKAWGRPLTPDKKVEPKEDLIELIVD